MSTNPFAELNCIAKVLNDKNPELLAKISPELISNSDLRNIYKIIRNHYVDSGTFLTFDTLTSKVCAICKTPDKTKFMAGMILQIKERDVTDLADDDLLKELNDYHKLRLLLGKTTELVSAIESKDAETALSILQSTYNAVFTEDVCKTEESDIGTISSRDDKLNFRTTGISEIDKHSGLAEGSFCVVSGGSGGGKSVMSHSILCHQYDKYRDSSVAYYSFEQGVSELAARMWSYYSDVDLGNIISGNLAEDEKFKLRLIKGKHLCDTDDSLEAFCNDTFKATEKEFLDLLYNTYPRRSNRIYLYDHSPSFEQMMIEAELLAKTKNVKLFVFDYLTIIAGGSNFKGLQQWQMYSEFAKEMKRFARKNKCYVISPMQLDKNKEQPTFRVASNILFDADLSLAMTQSKDDSELGCVNVHFMKYRNFTSIQGQNGLKDFKLLCDFKHSKFLPFDF